MQLINEQNFEQLFRENYIHLCRYANKFVADSSVVEDIVQNFFIEIWEKKHLAVQEDKFLAYACRAVKNSCIDYYRRNVIKENYFDALMQEWQEGIEAEEEEFLYKQEVQKALRRLPEKCRQVFLLKYVSDLTYKEISDLMDISVNTVKYHLKEALRIMRKELKKLFLIFFF